MITENPSEEQNLLNIVQVLVALISFPNSVRESQTKACGLVSELPIC